MMDKLEVGQYRQVIPQRLKPAYAIQIGDIIKILKVDNHEDNDSFMRILTGKYRGADLWHNEERIRTEKINEKKAKQLILLKTI